MKNSIITSLLIIFVSIFNVAYPQNSVEGNLTLDKAIRLALTNQPLIQQSEEDVKAADAKIKQQKSFDYPDVEGNLSYARLGPVSSIAFGESTFNLFPANNYNFNVQANYNLYDFGKKNALLDLTKSYKLTNEEKIEYIKNGLSYKTVYLFYSILYLEKDLKVKNDQINTLQNHLQITNKKEENGSATDFDILTTKVRVAAAENEKIDIENAITKQKIALKEILGLNSGETLNLSGDLALMQQSTNTDSLLAKAYSQREEMKIAADNVNSTKLRKHAASLEDMPQVNVVANYGLKNGYIPDLNVLRGNWILGISANIPIFNGFKKDARIEEEEANLNADNFKISALKRKIKTEVEQSVSQLKTSRSQLRIIELQVEQAEQAVKRAEASYENGVITNLDLLDAETSLAEARLLHLRVIYRDVINTYSLKEAVGDSIR